MIGLSDFGIPHVSIQYKNNNNSSSFVASHSSQEYYGGAQSQSSTRLTSSSSSKVVLPSALPIQTYTDGHVHPIYAITTNQASISI